MSKALKALESIRERVNTNDYGFYDHDAKRDAECDVIEKALKALETIDSCLIGQCELDSNCDTENAFGSPYRLRVYVGAYQYGEWILKSKDEYDLLKEVLWED